MCRFVCHVMLMWIPTLMMPMWVPTSMMSMKSKAVLRPLQSGHATAAYRRGTCEV